MPNIKGLHVENKEVYQDLDIEEITGLDFSGYEHVLLAMGQETIDYMLKRTNSSKDIFGKSFDSYSKPYKKSDEYEAYGKSSKVNMELSGDMKLAMDFKIEGNNLRFLFDDGDEEVKAYGHMTGMKGHKHLDGKAPTRMFFGISRDDFESEILPKFRDELSSIKEESKKDPVSSSESNSLFNALTVNETSSTTSVSTALDSYLKDLFNDEDF